MTMWLRCRVSRFKGIEVKGYVMKESRSSGRTLLVLPLLILFVLVLSDVVGAQGIPQLPAPSNPSNDCGCSGEGDAVPVSSGMLTPFLPRIPNLELGFLYYFGNRVNTGRFTADYVLPFRLSCDSVLFGEAHAEGWDFWKRPSVSVTTPAGFTVTTASTSNRVDLSFGGGYRTMLGANTLLGVNGFYDTSHLFNTWYSSGGVGLEYAANVAGDDAIDLNFNWYGNLFNRDVLVNAFRNKGNSFDVEAGYSHAMFNRSLDLRLKVIGYQFGIGTGVYGWRGGADLTTRDGVFTLRYEYGHDRIDGYYNTVGGFINIGFQLENLLSGESPFTLPEPVFRSPRDLRRLLGLKVKRNWHQPEAVVLARAAPASAAACSNLSGSVLLITSMSEFPNVYPTNPSIPIGAPGVGAVTVCWCGLTTSVDVNFLFFDGAQGAETLLPISMTPGAGCASVAQTGPNVDATPNGVAASSPLTFSPGGGLSFTFP